MLARFKNMWPGFVPTRSPLLSLIARALEQPLQVTQNPHVRVDIEVGSIFPSRRRYVSGLVASSVYRVVTRADDIRYRLADSGKSKNATMGIWFTGECTPSPSTGWDCYLGYEVFEDHDRAYLPLWLLHSDMFGLGDPAFLGASLRIDELSHDREREYIDAPTKFCCAILRNPHPIRMRAIEALSRLGAVDVFGPIVKKPIPNKLDVMQNYRFAIAFENTLYPGYVTEKVFDAWTAGCIPLYWGLDSRGFLNDEAIVNFARQDTLMDSIDRVRMLIDDSALRESYWQRALLRRRPQVVDVIEVSRQAALRTGLI